jgi:membrane protease YdiL (CAAX protease family)
MHNVVRKELEKLYVFLSDNYRETAVIVLAILFFILHKYHPLEPEWSGALLYFFLLPLLSIIVILRRNPLDFGLGSGNFRAWWPYTLATIVVAVPVLFACSGIDSLREYYTRPDLDLLTYIIGILIYLFSWEFIFRGFLLFGLRDKLGILSVVFQMVPFVILHFGKPELEVISTIFTGLWFGYICYRGNSFWPAFIMHSVINISFIIFVNICR